MPAGSASPCRYRAVKQQQAWVCSQNAIHVANNNALSGRNRRQRCTQPENIICRWCSKMWGEVGCRRLVFPNNQVLGCLVPRRPSPLSQMCVVTAMMAAEDRRPLAVELDRRRCRWAAGNVVRTDTERTRENVREFVETSPGQNFLLRLRLARFLAINHVVHAV